MGFMIDLDLKKCTACGACAIACMDQNDIEPEKGIRPFRTVFDRETGGGPDGRKAEYVHVSIACMHCEDAPCITACPCACIRKDEATNLTVYDNTRCIGCHSCAMACPFGAPSFGADGKMRKCDGCVTRIRNGLEPACVRNCPTGALRCVDEEGFKRDHVEHSLKRLAQLIQP